MSRPAFTLTDDQARRLIAEVGPILERHPAGGRNHRPFVREFVRAVYAATGRTCSPVLYRRLLDVYAPGRTPSTATLEQEKNTLVAELAQQSRATVDLSNGSVGDDLSEVVQRAVQTALARQAPAVSAGAIVSDQIALAQRDFLQARLSETEQLLNQVRAHAAQLAADLQATRAVLAIHEQHSAAAQADAVRQGELVAQLTNEVGAHRRFMLQAVDAVRGETRAWKDHCTALEVQLIQSKQLVEVFRQAAYARGAAIPKVLQQEDPVP